MALAATGRIVSLDQLSAWRKDGLLPPMASTGLGTGKGKSYYWQDEDILVRTQTVYDAMRRHGRTDQTLITLFLSGFAVPLPQLRRAWLHRAKMRRPTVVRAVRKNRGTGPLVEPGAGKLLLEAALCVGAAVETDDRSHRGAMPALLDQALSKLGQVRHGVNDPGLADQIWHLLGIIGSVLDASDLIREAHDDDLRTAQRHLGVAMAFLSDCNDAAEVLVETLGPQVFMFFLTLLHSGQVGTLDRVMAYVDGASWQAVLPPARNRSISV